jgi:hypothetical protein
MTEPTSVQTLAHGVSIGFIPCVKQWIQTHCPGSDNLMSLHQFLQKIETWTMEQWAQSTVECCQIDAEWIQRVEEWLHYQSYVFGLHFRTKSLGPVIHPPLFLKFFMIQFLRRFIAALENCRERVSQPKLLDDLVCNFHQICHESMYEQLLQSWMQWIHLLRQNSGARLMQLTETEIQMQARSPWSKYVIYRQHSAYTWMDQDPAYVTQQLLQQQVTALQSMIRLLQHQQRSIKKRRRQQHQFWKHWMKQLRYEVHHLQTLSQSKRRPHSVVTTAVSSAATSTPSSASSSSSAPTRHRSSHRQRKRQSDAVSSAVSATSAATSPDEKTPTKRTTRKKASRPIKTTIRSYSYHEKKQPLPPPPEDDEEEEEESPSESEQEQTPAVESSEAESDEEEAESEEEEENTSDDEDDTEEKEAEIDDDDLSSNDDDDDDHSHHHDEEEEED